MAKRSRWDQREAEESLTKEEPAQKRIVKETTTEESSSEDEDKCSCAKSKDLAAAREKLDELIREMGKEEETNNGGKEELERKETEIKNLKDKLQSKQDEMNKLHNDLLKKDDEIVSLNSKILLFSGKQDIVVLDGEDLKDKLEALEEKYKEAKTAIEKKNKTEKRKEQLLQQARKIAEDERKKIKKMMAEEEKQKTSVHQMEKWTEQVLDYEDNEEMMSTDKLKKEMKNYEEVFAVIEDNVEKTLEESTNLLKKEEFIFKLEKPHNSNKWELKMLSESKEDKKIAEEDKKITEEDEGENEDTVNNSQYNSLDDFIK